MRSIKGETVAWATSTHVLHELPACDDPEGQLDPFNWSEGSVQNRKGGAGRVERSNCCGALPILIFKVLPEVPTGG
jgi:hypothetical protein